MQRGSPRVVRTGAAAAVLLAVAAQSSALASSSREGGIFRVSFSNVDFMDPALAYFPRSWHLLDTTCARLMTYPDKPPPEGLRLVPEVAAAFPKISRNAKTYTFKLRSGFRFSDGTPVRANAFARAINRVLALGERSPALQYLRDTVGAADVQAGTSAAAAGVVARGNTLTIRFTRPVPDFAAKTTMPFFCAVPPALPVDPEGVGSFPAAGPYAVTEYRPGERVVLRRNRFYGGSRPRHVDGFDVDLRAGSNSEALDRVERGEADWTWVPAPIYFEPGRRLTEKYGVNKSRFFVRPGLTLEHVPFNVRRPLFRDNPGLRRAVNYAINRRALVRVATPSPLTQRLSDQYLPSTLPGFKDADIYPLERGDLRRARALARGNLRGGKATLYVDDRPQPVAIAQLMKRQLAGIGLDVEVTPLPIVSLFSRLANPDEPWDLVVGAANWNPDFIDPSAYLNLLFDGRHGGLSNAGWFDSTAFNRELRKAARVTGAARYRTYGDLDVRLARDAVPSIAISFRSEPTLVSKRVGCIVLRPALDLTAVCLN